MATKIYKLNQKRNSATFPLYANDGKMKVEYEFSNGNVLMKQPARCTLRNAFYQNLLESSTLFKNKIVTLERVIDDVVEEEKDETEYQNVDSVKTLSDAIDYVANTWGVQVKTIRQAKSIANKKGVDFPNLS